MKPMRIRKKNRRLMNDERALARAIRIVKLRRFGYYAYIGDNLRYRRMLAFDEYETIEVCTYEDLVNYYAHEGRMMRDTRKKCSCLHCGNPRFIYLNSWRGKTKQEKVSLLRLYQDMEDIDNERIYNFHWRAVVAKRGQ